MVHSLIVAVLSFQLIFQSLGIHAQTPSHEEILLSSLHAAQGKTISSDKKQEVLNRATDYLKEHLKKKYNLDDSKLAKLLLEDTPEAVKFRKKLYLCDDPNNLTTCNVRNLYSGINSLASTMVLNGQMNQCRKDFNPQWLQDQPITQSLLNAEADFDPRCEGAVANSAISLYSKSKIKGKTTAWPLLYSGSSLANLVNTSEGIITTSQLNVERKFFGKRFPKYDEVKTLMTDSDYVGIMMQEQLKDAVYERAVVNSLATKYSIKASFGSASYKELTDPKAMLKEISLACVHCDSKQKDDMRLRLLNILTRKIPKEVREAQKHQDVIASKICNQLNQKGYFDNLKKKPDLATRELMPNEVFIYGSKKDPEAKPGDKPLKFDLKSIKKSNLKGVYGDGPKSASDTAYYDQLFVAERQDKGARTKGIAELAMQGQEGLLLLTDALTEKNESHEATRVNLGCSSYSRDNDAALIESAVKEIDSNVQTYLDDLNKNVLPMQPLNKNNIAKISNAQSKALKFMVSKNPTAAGEALQDFPLSTKLMCSTLADIFYDQFWENDKKTLIMVGAGAASLLTAGLASVPLAILGNLAITTALTTEQYFEAEAASEDYKDFKNAFFAQQGKDNFSREEMQAAFVEWQALKLDWSTAFGYVPDVLSMGTLLKQYHTFAALRKAIPLLKKTEKVNDLKLVVTEAKTIQTRIVQKEIADNLNTIKKLQATGASKAEVDLAIRAVYTNPKFKYDDIADVMLKDVKQSSNELKNALKKAPKDEELRTYDYVYVGAGIHTGIAKATFAEQLAANGVKTIPKVLTIEATENVSVFGRLGSSFRGNTLESAKLGTPAATEAERLALIAESKNFQANSAIQVADIGKTQVPVAGQFQAPAMTSHWQTKGDFLLGSPVKSIKEIKKTNGEILYEIQMKTGETVFSKNIVMGTGLGKGKLPTSDLKSIEYIKTQTGKPDQKVFFVEDLLEDINNKSKAGENFRTPFEGKKVIVVGGGHGGAIGIEAVEGLGPEALYKNIPGAENNKGPSSYLWVNLKAQTGDEFKKVIGGGDRYYGLAPLIDNGKIQTNQFYLHEVLPNGKGGIKVSFLDKTTGKPVLDANGKIAYTEGDYLVYATGYENQNNGMLSSFAGKEGVQFNPVQANITPNDPRLVHDVPVTVATQVIGADGKAKNIFAVGPSAGQIPHAKDPGGPTSVTINLFGSRSEALGKMLADQVKPK